jgi:hypothetical protein
MIEDPENFKQQLYENFKKTGILDNLKAAMRQQLAEKLLKKPGPEDESEEEGLTELKQEEEFEKYLYGKSIMGNVISDFLYTHQLNYTYSVLLPEIKLQTNDILPTN